MSEKETPVTSFEPRLAHPLRKIEAGLPCEEHEGRLWSMFKAGDEDAFTSLYNKYVVKLYHYGERICQGDDLIQDSLHDFFVELWKNRATISQPESVKSYLYKGFKNRLVKNIQKRKKLPLESISDDYQFEIVFSFESHLISEQISDEQKRILQEAINELSPRQKEALTLKFFDELSYQQIAEVMMLPVKSVYMLIYRAIDWLRENVKLRPGLLFSVLLLSFFL